MSHNPPLPRQSRAMSLTEAVANTLVGYLLAVLTQILVFPLFGLDVALPAHLGIGLAFMAVSLARSYLLRRLFERLRAKTLPAVARASR